MSERITVQQAADLAGYSKRWFENLLKLEGAPAIYQLTPRGKRFLEREDVCQWIANNKQGAA